MAYKRSVFPEGGYDIFKEKYDISPDKEVLVDEYYALWKKTDRTTLEDNRLNQLGIELEPYLYTAENTNHYQDAMSNVQKFFVENTQGHIDGLKVETTDYVDLKKSEIDTTVTNAQNTINTTKDAALISIENKKNNVIDYLDGTTAGALRNDIGDMVESEIEGRSLVDKTNKLNTDVGNVSVLSTDDKTNLVNAINEHEEQINSLDAEVVEHKADKATHGINSHILKGVLGEFPYVMPGWASNTIPNTTLPNGEIFYTPIYVSNKTKFNAIGVIVRTAVANTKVEIRIYDMNKETTLPSNQLVNVGIIDTATTGIKEVIVELELEAGYYFVGIKSTGNPVIGCINYSDTILTPTTARLNGTTTGTSNLYIVTGNMAEIPLMPTGFSPYRMTPLILFKLGGI